LRNFSTRVIWRPGVSGVSVRDELDRQIRIFPLHFYGEVTHQETRVMGLLWGEGFVILSSTVFDWSTRVTDGQTDIQTDGR